MGNVVIAVIDIVVFLVGLFVIGIAQSVTGAQAIVFLLGILIVVAACAFPFTVLDRR